MGREDRLARSTTRLLLAGKGARRATSGGGSDGEAESNASAKGDFDQALWIGVRLGAPKEAVGEAGGDAVWLDHGERFPSKGERQA
jgi:hypothetical protein